MSIAVNTVVTIVNLYVKMQDVNVCVFIMFEFWMQAMRVSA